MDLLEYARRKTGCLEISDLPFLLDENGVRQVFCEIPASACTLREWNDALGYLLHQTGYAQAGSVEEINLFLSGQTPQTQNDRRGAAGNAPAAE